MTDTAIIACPECGASYRLPRAILGQGKRMRCADCEHRWVPDAPPAAPVISEDEALAAMQAALLAERAAPPPEPEPEHAPEPPAEPEPEPSAPRPAWISTVVVLIAGLALAILAAGLWLPQIDLSRIPGAGPMLSGLGLARPALQVTATGNATRLPSGQWLLEVSGSIRNPGTTTATLPDLRATLSSPRGIARRWTIAAPAAALAPGRSIGFTSTTTGFPDDATQLTVRTLR